MEKTNLPIFSVSDFIALTNQTLEYAYPVVEIEGEVGSFKVNQGKYVFFDLKDDKGSLSCFMSVWQLRLPVEDGMRVVVTAQPKLTAWGKFSLTIRAIKPVGEGSLKKSFELLKAKLDKEGLFDPARKRILPETPQHVAVISSTQAAGYADFIKILNDRFGGLKVEVAQVQVQGESAPDQIIRALKYFNSRQNLPEVIVIVRGGGSADDLAAFNDELLVRAIAASRVPTLVGVGHEVDVSLSDMVADVRAATPSNAAQILVPDRKEMIRQVQRRVSYILPRVEQAVAEVSRQLKTQLIYCLEKTQARQLDATEDFMATRRLLRELDPHQVLARGYALVRGEMTPGSQIQIEKSQQLITAEVKHVQQK